MLSVSKLLQWENVSSAPIDDNEIDYGEGSLEALFDHAITLSQTSNDLTMEMRKLFVSTSPTSGFSAKRALQPMTLGDSSLHMKNHLNHISTITSFIDKRKEGLLKSRTRSVGLFGDSTKIFKEFSDLQNMPLVPCYFLKYIILKFTYRHNTY